MYDVEIVKDFYSEFGAKVERARKALDRPLTLTEKSCMPTSTTTGR